MASVEWQAYYFSSLYESSPFARKQPNEAVDVDDATAVGVRMDLSKRYDVRAAVSEPPGHCAILSRGDPSKTPALH
jgi:hypothetical protein